MNTKVQKSKTVSIIIPTYNSEELLARTLAGLVKQTYPAKLIEVVVADDGSSDGVEELVERSTPPWDLKFVKQADEGFRLATVRNKAILKAKNEVIINLDADMIPLPEFVAAHMKWFHQARKVATIGVRRFVSAQGITPAEIERDPGRLRLLPDIASNSNWFMTRDRRLMEIEKFKGHPAPYNVFHGCNVAYLKAHAVQVGLYDEDFNGNWGYEDTEFAYRLWRHGVEFVIEPRALALHQENEVTSFEQRVVGDQRNFMLACRKIPEFKEFKTKFNASNRVPWWS